MKEDEDEEEEMDEESNDQETPMRGRSERLTAGSNTSATSANTSSKKTPASRKTQQKKREGVELKGPSTKRKQTASIGVSSATPKGRGAGGDSSDAFMSAMTEMKDNRGCNMFRSMLSGKSALKVHVRVHIGVYVVACSSNLLQYGATNKTRQIVRNVHMCAFLSQTFVHV